MMLKQVSSAGVLLAALMVQQAQAGVSPPVISGSYYEQNGTQSCGSGSASSSGSSGATNPVTVCQDLFSAPPAAKQIALDTVACNLQVDIRFSATVKDAYLAQNVGGSISRKHPLAAQLQTQDANNAYYSIDTYLGGGYVVVGPVRVVMNLTDASYISMDCQITGTLRSTP